MEEIKADSPSAPSSKHKTDDKKKLTTRQKPMSLITKQHH